MAKRFFVNDNEINISGENISVIGNEVHHINVLRHKIGDSILINNYVVKITNLDKEKLVGIIEDIEDENNKNNVKINLYQAYLKSDKMEFVVQKAVEIGASNIFPFLSKNCVVKLDDKDKLKKLDRLNKISFEASKQCGRSDIVKVNDILNIHDDKFKQALSQNTINILAYENSQNRLKEVLKKLELASSDINVGIIIGPEGGFADSDLQILKEIPNTYEISLGKNILRAETASINLLSIVNYEIND